MPKEDLVIAGIFTLLGAVITATANWLNSQKQRADEKRKQASREFLDESIKLLERAYEIFTLFGDAPPRNDRLLWLSTARMIVRFQRMKSRITEPEHCSIADEHEEYWRLLFYTLLQKNKDSFTLEYFIPSNDVDKVDVIPRKPIKIITGFSEWKGGMPDPLDLMDDKKLFPQKRQIVPIARPYDFDEIIRHLDKYPACWTEELDRRKSKSQGS